MFFATKLYQMYVEKSTKSLDFSSDFAAFVVIFLIIRFLVISHLGSGLTSCRYIYITKFKPTELYVFN